MLRLLPIKIYEWFKIFTQLLIFILMGYLVEPVTNLGAKEIGF